MDRATLLDLLARAEQHVVMGRRQIDSQYRIIAKLEREGHDTTAAIDLLKQFVEAQETYERDRDRLMSKLATAS
jgi:IS4 transposase